MRESADSPCRSRETRYTSAPADAAVSRMRQRNRCPVFVMGCPRSGTNLLYDTLLSSGGFAIYRGRLPVHQVLIPRFGSPYRLENRRRMIAAWLRSKGFRKTELDADDVTARLMEHCRTGGDFLSIVMGEIARKQGAPRWAVYDPDTVLRVATIKREIPDALFIHIIRDGRDIAISLRKLGGFNPFPWSRGKRSLEETALYWQWLVQKGRRDGAQIPQDYTEIHYEELVCDPRGTLGKLSAFIDHDLDYDRIQANAMGTLSKSNSSFRDAASSGGSPVQRWKQTLMPEQVASLEWHIGKMLETTGYAKTISRPQWKPTVRDRWLRASYASFLNGKHWMKLQTPLGRFTSLADLDLSNAPEPQATSAAP